MTQPQGGFGPLFWVEEWPVHQGWLAWVLEVWKPGGRVQQQKDDHPSRLEFAAVAAESLGRAGSFRQIKTWVSVQKPEIGEGFADGYPHTHEPPHGLTLVHYLQTGNDPAPLVIGRERIEPYPGLTVFMPNTLEHGVLKHHGEVDRIQLIATGL